MTPVFFLRDAEVAVSVFTLSPLLPTNVFRNNTPEAGRRRYEHTKSFASYWSVSLRTAPQSQRRRLFRPTIAHRRQRWVCGCEREEEKREREKLSVVSAVSPMTS